MDVHSIFDAFNQASDYIGLRDQQMRKQAQINGVTSRRCGNCDHWMKTTCVPEKVHKQFKSCDSFACGAFTRSYAAQSAANTFIVELGEINRKLTALRRSEGL